MSVDVRRRNKQLSKLRVYTVRTLSAFFVLLFWIADHASALGSNKSGAEFSCIEFGKYYEILSVYEDIRRRLFFLVKDSNTGNCYIYSQDNNLVSSLGQYDSDTIFGLKKLFYKATRIVAIYGAKELNPHNKIIMEDGTEISIELSPNLGQYCGFAFPDYLKLSHKRNINQVEIFRIFPEEITTESSSQCDQSATYEINTRIRREPSVLFLIGKNEGLYTNFDGSFAVMVDPNSVINPHNVKDIYFEKAEEVFSTENNAVQGYNIFSEDNIQDYFDGTQERLDGAIMSKFVRGNK